LFSTAHLDNWGKKHCFVALYLNNNVVKSVIKLKFHYHISGTQSGTVLRHVLDQRHRRNWPHVSYTEGSE